MPAFYARVPLGHVEAGLRSFDPARPWPEEFNRVAVDALADLLFAPTEGAAENLRREYARRGRIVVTGNTGIDSLLAVADRLATDPALRASVARALPALDPSRRLILVTAHRRESFGSGLAGICCGPCRLGRARRCGDRLAPPPEPGGARSRWPRRSPASPAVRLIEPARLCRKWWR
ncbi:MAG: UDP-N-acetylglucosamine 2-epimerase [Acetobacteraceae bacterium]|nr:UDP-N-acetylglucosamine 2-epimerase [Acetobacteraceae bacterium]